MFTPSKKFNDADLGEIIFQRNQLTAYDRMMRVLEEKSVQAQKKLREAEQRVQCSVPGALYEDPQTYLVSILGKAYAVQIGTGGVRITLLTVGDQQSEFDPLP